MHIDRRTLLAGTVAGLAAAPALAQRAAKQAGWYRNAIVIDGLGGLSDPYNGPDVLRLTDRTWAESKMTGVTAVRDTLLPVGNLADAWEQFQKELSTYHNYFLANPDRLKLVEHAAEGVQARRASRRDPWHPGHGHGRARA